MLLSDCSIVLVIVCIVSSIRHVVGTESFVLANQIRGKRDYEKWIWGEANDADSNTHNSNLREAPKEDNPCERPESKMPDFKAPGRRISELKCYEYIWDIKLRAERSKNNYECDLYKSAMGEFIMEPVVVGGHDAAPGEFPHMAGIGWKATKGKWIFKCGGSLISSKFVVTAAHCTWASPKDSSIADPVPKIVRLGDKNIIDEYSNGIFPINVKISRIIVHPQYKSPKKYFDIALMELEKKVEFHKNVQPACLWANHDTSRLGNNATVTGWGVIETAGRKTSPSLQAGDVNIIDTPKCNELLKPFCNRHWCGINETQICAGKLSGGVDACQGDSGGPLQVKIPLPKTAQGAMHYLIGVTSFGFGCARAEQPGVYTRISSFIDWIEAIVWQ